MKVLIVDDEEMIRGVLKEYVEFEGGTAYEAGDGMEAVKLCRENDFDIILMDIMMPRLDGFSAVKEIKKFKDIPVIMLSARSEEYDKLFGFEIGVDDYVTKPFSPKEVMARINAVLKRKHGEDNNKDVITFEGLTIDMVGRNVYVDGEKAELTPKEYEILFYFVKNKNIALTREAASKDLDINRVQDVREIAGHGIEAQIDGQKVCVGNAKMMDQKVPEGNGFGTCVYVSVNGGYRGMIEIADEIKEDSKTAIDLLRHFGVKRFIMLTGDSEKVAQKVAGAVHIDEVHAQLLPDQKVQILDQILKTKNEKEKVAFVGDGINDAPVLTQADVGIAMGGLGSDAAIEAADIVLMEDQLSQIVTAMQISKKTLRIVYENIWFALIVKALVLILAALGITNMWAAVFADVGVSFIAILNAMRALKVDKIRQ